MDGKGIAQATTAGRGIEAAFIVSGDAAPLAARPGMSQLTLATEAEISTRRVESFFPADGLTEEFAHRVRS